MKFFIQIVIYVFIDVMVVLGFFPSLWRNVVNPKDLNVPAGQFLTMLSIIAFLVIPLIPLPISSVLNRLLHPTNTPNCEERAWTSLHLGNICASVVAYIVLFFPRDRDAARIFFDGDSALAHGVIVAEFLCILMAGLIANRCFQTWEAVARHLFRLALNAIFTYFSLYYLSFMSTPLAAFMFGPVIISLFAILVTGMLGYWLVHAMNNCLNLFAWVRLEDEEAFYSLLGGASLAALATLIQSYKIQNVSLSREAWMHMLPDYYGYFLSYFSFLACLGMLAAAIGSRIHEKRAAVGEP